MAPFYLFAGLPFAWYCFMPNFGVLSEKKIYRSQLTIHLDILINKSKYLWKKTTLPRDIEWKACRYDAFDEFAAIIPAEFYDSVTIETLFNDSFSSNVATVLSSYKVYL